MAKANTTPVSSGSPTNWTMICIVAIAAVAIVAIVGMMRPDSFKGAIDGDKGPQIEIQKRNP
jgi:hypothetical protein